MSKSYGTAESVLIRADAYRVGMSTMTRVSAILAVTAAAAISTAGYVVTNQPEPRYFATTQEGRLTPMVPLDRPHLSPDAVTNYAVQAITGALTYDFANYRSDFQTAQRWFTKPAGWNSFVDAVQDSGTLDLVKKKRFNTTAIAQNAVIVREGIAGGVYEWLVQVPVKVAYQSASEVTSQNLLVSVRLQRLPTWQSAEGVAIAQFVASPGGT